MKTVKIPPELHRELKIIAAKQEKELAFVIETALSEWVKKVKREESNSADNLKTVNV